MKTILVPTDYSAASTNAVHYACKLAKEDNAAVLLFHVFHIPYPSNDMTVPAVNFKQLEKAEHERMEKFIIRLNKDEGEELKITGVVRPGLVADEIKDYCKNHKVSLIAMGISGGGALKEFFIGSNALSVSKNAECDVLIIPAKAKFKKVKCISLASDLVDIDVNTISAVLKHYCTLFGAKAEIINVKNSFTLPKEERIQNRKKIVKALEGVKSEVIQPYEEEAAVAIERHIELKKSDWVAVVHRDHGFFSGLFHKSLTKQLAFHSDIPVLSIHQHKK